MTQTLRLVCLVLLMAAPIFAQSGTPAYTVSELPRSASPDDAYRFATDINDAGQVIGMAHIFGDDKVVFWDHAPAIVIGGNTDGAPGGINGRGQVVWNDTGVPVVRAHLWDAGTNTLLDSLGQSSGASAINDAGQIVGCSALLVGPGCQAAVMWSGGEIVRLGTFRVSATAINNSGQIVLGAPPLAADGQRIVATAPVFLWDNGVVSELPGLSVATDINDRGEILGMSEGRPVIWAHGIITPLVLPPGEWVVSTGGINNLGHAVGTITSTAAGAPSTAVLWQNGEVITLPALVANEPTSAAAINNRNEIVGMSGFPPVSNLIGTQKAVLWTPQTPTTPGTPPDAGPAPGTQAPPIDLGTLGGTYSTPTGINETGVIVGSSTTGGKEQHAFAWTPTNGMMDLGTFGDRSTPGVALRTSFATAANSTSDVAGASYVPGPSGGYRAFLWTQSAGMQIIGTSTVTFSDAIAINDSGQVVGNNGSSEVWTSTGGWVDIGTLGGGVRPVANNNLGQVVGTSSLGIASFPEHAFVWTSSGGMTDLGTLGGPSSAAAAVNESGHVVGAAQTAGGTSDNNWRAFLWTTSGGMVNLGSLGGPYSIARDVNDLDMVVGTSAVATGDARVHAFIWMSAAGMQDLGTLGGTHSEAYAVSDTGQVVGRSLTSGDAAWHAFAWTPSSGMVDLVPLAGYTDSVAYLVNSNGAVVGSSYDRVSGTYRATMWTVFGAPPGEFTFCATEGAPCEFTGTMEVRYGANGSFVFRTLTDGTACTNDVFGDPAPNTPKQCAIRTATTPPPPDWTVCTVEGGFCAFSGMMDVRYGANGLFVIKTFTDGTACTNDVFGDPAPNTPKQCAIRTPTTPPPTDWAFCAPEGGVCAFTGTMGVRYGGNGVFVFKTFTGGTACTNEVFGDPAPNVAKSCSVRPTGP